MDKKTCFIIMPITTPDYLISQYSNDEDHFLHVLDYLIIPAIEKAGLNPISPSSRGSEVIHADIIHNIESADFVLCDMSILNPNVFFELGIRTALNKPMCIIRDDITPKIPFDTALINNHMYSSSLHPWILEEEIEKLSEHLIESIKKNEDCNSLWKYFSLSSTAQPIKPDEGIDGKIEMLTMQVEALRKENKESKNLEIYKTKLDSDTIDMDAIIDKLAALLLRKNITFSRVFHDHDNSITITGIDDQSVEMMKNTILVFALKHGFSVLLGTDKGEIRLVRNQKRKTIADFA